MPTAWFAQISVGVVVNFAPPPLPVYEQPICPGDGYIWTPGYWAYGDDFNSICSRNSSRRIDLSLHSKVAQTRTDRIVG